MPRICIYLSEDTMKKFETLTAENGGKPSKTVEILIENAFQNLKNGETGDKENLRRLRVIENDTNKRVQVLTELFNSYLNTFGACSADDFFLSSDSPHPWLTLAEQGITQKIEQLQQEKFMRGGK